MPPHKYLPSLHVGTENSVATPAQPGVWDDAQSNTRLSKLANAIIVPPGASRIHSIPDPWARVILFDRALFDEGHVLHGEVLGEWRGLLGLLGLRERRRFNGLQVVPVHLNADPKSFQRGMFSSVIARVMPTSEDLLSSDASWSDFHLLRWKRYNSPTAQVFALTSPSTLVATGVSYPGIIGQDEVPWFNGRVLTDPGPLISSLERTALAEWVLWLRSKLSGGQVNDSLRRDRMLEILRDFATDLAPNARELGDAAILGETSLANLHGGLFGLLSKSRKSEIDVLTEVEIVTDRPGAPRYVLIDPSLAYQLNRPEREILVYRDETLSTAIQRVALQKKGSGTYKDSSGKTAEIRWCTPAFFFQSDLIYERNDMAQDSKEAEAFPGCRDIKVFGDTRHRHILLPLTEEAAGLFTPETLEANFSIEWLSDEEARCRLKLPIRSDDNSAQGGLTSDITIERMYYRDTSKLRKDNEPSRQANGMIRIGNLPALCIWPNFSFPDHPKTNQDPEKEQETDNRWKKYFLFEAWRTAEMAKEFVVRPLGASDADGRQISQTNSFFQIYTMSRFPEVLVCQMPFVEGRPRHPDQSPPRGLLLLREAQEKPSFTRGRTAALGVDFGTTGTGIYRAFDITSNRGEQEDIKQMAFKDRLFRVTGYDKNAFEQITRDLFIPGRDWSAGKILSVFQDFGRGGNGNAPTYLPPGAPGNGQGSRMPLRDGHVLFADEKKPAAFIMGDPDSIRSDLKWGDPRQNDAARGFLAQLCIQSVAELVCAGADSIEVRYSYPTAFSDRDVLIWNGIWGHVIKEDVRTATSIKLTTSGADLKDQTANREAVAATRYFSHPSNLKRMNITRGALTLDIGGGTTDVAVWNLDPNTRQPTLMAHLSVLFAGRDMFLAPIRRFPRILTEINDAIALQTLTGKTGDAFKAQLDALVSAYGDAMLGQLAFKSNNVKVQEFLAILELGLCGIAFYSGLLVGRLVETGEYQPGKTIPVFAGGNGSKLLNWCALGQFTPQAGIHKKFAFCLIQGAKRAAPSLADTTVEVVLSESPKEEVAFGLVARATELAISDQYTNPLAGESYRIIHKGDKNGGESKQWNESPDADSVRDHVVIVDREMPIFATFLRAMNPRLTSAAIEAEVDDISAFVDSSFLEMKDALRLMSQNNGAGDAPDPMRKEPIFIMALKRLLEKKTNAWVSHG